MKRSLLLLSLSSVLTLGLLAGTASAAVPQVAVADGATCFLADNGAVSCQGNNAAGQLAQPDTVTSSVTPLGVSGLPEVRDIDAGDEHFCAVSTAGGVICWGEGTSGQIGDGGSVLRRVPTTVPGVSGVIQISTLDDDVCALLAGGAVKCWGDNSGQFGASWASGDYPNPVDVPGFDGATRIADGDDVLCGLFPGGTVKCQGNNSEGQAGQPSAVTEVGAPLEVPGVSGAVDVAAGEDFTCALISGGTVKCWGDGADGRLGQGADVDDKFAPVDVQGLNGVVKLVLGEEHACALRSDGVVLCWGESSNGQSGQAADFVGTPTPPTGLGPAVDLFVGYDAACAILSGGSVACWGDNQFGGLGEPLGDVVSVRTMLGIDLVTLPQQATSAALTFAGKAKVDRKKRNYTRSAVLTITPSKYSIVSEVCSEPAIASTKYRYTVVRKRKGKRVKVRRTKTIRAKANLTAVGSNCVAKFSLKRLPVKYLNKKRITVTATVAATTTLSAVNVSAKTKLPKVKIKKRKKR